MEGKRNVTVSLSTSVDKKDATKSTKMELSVAFSVADVAGIALYLSGMLANALYRPYALGDQLGDANLLFAAFTFGQVPLFAALLLVDRRLVHADVRFHRALVATAAALSLANCAALFLPSIGIGARIALWAVSGLGYSGVLLAWCMRLAVFPMKRIAFHAMLAAFGGSAFFLAVALLAPEGMGRVVFAVLPAASAACFVRATRVFPDEFPPLIRIKRVYERRSSFVKLVIFSAGYGLAYGFCFSFLPLRGIEGDVLAWSYSLGLLLAGCWLFTNLFVFKRSVPTNATMLLALFLLSSGIIVLVGEGVLLTVALALFVMFFVLHLDQCARKTLKCSNAFQGRFFKLLAVECTVNLVCLGAGSVAGDVFLSLPTSGQVEQAVLFWVVAVSLVFVTMFCSVDSEKKLSTYLIPAQQRAGSVDRGDSIVVSALIKSVATDYGLSARQTEVLSMLAKGRNASVIERELVISSNTAKSHIYTVYQKLGVHSQQELLDFIEDYREA